MPSAFEPSGSDPLERRLAAEDPREALRLKIEVRERVIAAIELRLQARPYDQHQLFLLEEHTRARDSMSEQLRRLNMEQDLRYQDLDAFVGEYVQQMNQVQAAPPPEQQAQIAALQQERRTWEEMIEKVRARLVKRPGDPRLMQLLAEHQARLLRIQHSQDLLRGQAEGAPADDSLVLEKLAAPAPAEAEAGPIPAASPRRQALEREIEVFAGMIEKTRQRLAAKPELVHLKELIRQHEERLKELNARLAETE